MKKVLTCLCEIFFNPIDIIRKITVSIWKAMREINLVFITLEFMSERKCIIVLLKATVALTSVPVLIVRDF